MKDRSRADAVTRRLRDRAVMNGRLDELVALPGPPIGKRIDDAANVVKGRLLELGPVRWLNDLRKGARR